MPFVVCALTAAAGLLIVVAEVSNEHDAAVHAGSLVALFVLFVLALTSYTLVIREAAPLLDEDLLDAMRREMQVVEAASAAKVRYLANVSHELRSPLNAIYGYAQLIERGAGGSPAESAAVIRRSTEHLTGLVEGLLDFSQLEAGVLRVKLDVADLGDFVDHIASMMRPIAAAKGLGFRYDRPPSLPFVRMDQNRLRQVLINLLSNAAKFTAEGEVGFRVRHSGQIATFEVSDTGPGVRAEDAERIFNPFETGDAQPVAERAGIGLGLPIARAIVEILGGKLELVGGAGKGACFRVTLHLGTVAGTLPKREVRPQVLGYEGYRRSVLVVDDDASQLSFVKRLLASLGFDVVTAADGETAVAIGAERRFDLAILDLRLPGMSGWDAATRLRALQGANLRVIVLSANVAEFHKPEAADPAHDLFLMKPVRLADLTEAVSGLLGLSWKVAMPAPVDEAPRCPLSPLPPGDAAARHIERLRELLRTGHVRAIEREIGLLGEVSPAAAELSAELYDQLDRFDLAAMARRLDQA